MATDSRQNTSTSRELIPVTLAYAVLTFLMSLPFSLTPGTLSLEVDRSGAVLYVHVLDLGDGDGAADDVRASIGRMERLLVAALGPADQTAPR